MNPRGKRKIPQGRKNGNNFFETTSVHVRANSPAPKDKTNCKPSFANERSRVRLRVNGSCERKLFMLFPNPKKQTRKPKSKTKPKTDSIRNFVFETTKTTLKNNFFLRTKLEQNQWRNRLQNKFSERARAGWPARERKLRKKVVHVVSKTKCQGSGKMTMNQAIRRIRRHAPETEATFRAICRNRYCRPVRKWAIYDLSKLHKLTYESAERRYKRHFRRLQTLFSCP